MNKSLSLLSSPQTLCALVAMGISMAPSTADAGSFGLYGQAGMHEGKAYYYRSDGKQGVDSQFLPDAGTGFEMMLGDKDDRLIGLIRIAWRHDWTVNNPQYTVSNDEDGNPYTYTHPDYESVPARNDGLITVGLQWGLWGEPTGFQVTALTALTSGFWTVDNLEYFSPEVGAGVTYTIADQIQFHGTLTAAPRYRKQVYLGANTYVGVRYLFD
jgi:hypothetical protein